MIRVVDGNLIHADEEIIAHQVNCRGKMGSGVAAQVRTYYPEAFNEYVDLVRYVDSHNALCGSGKNNMTLLGRCQIVSFDRDGHKMNIANLFAQDRYGYDGKQYTNYTAFEKCIDNLKIGCKNRGIKRIAMPYKIGCGRGGGNWDIIQNIIDKGLRHFDVTLYRYEEK